MANPSIVVCGRLAGLVLLSGCTAVPDSHRAATPQRPTVSSDTNTTAEKTFELEAGIESDDDGGFRSPTAIKFGATSHTDVTLFWQPWQVVPIPGPDGEGPGDLGFGIKHRLMDGDATVPNLAVLGGFTLPTGNRSEGLGSGNNDLFAGAAADWNLPEDFVLTAFYQLGVIGDDGGGVEFENIIAAAVSARLAETWTAFGELAYDSFNNRFLDPVIFSTGATWAPWGEATVLDAGVRVGLNDDARDLAVFVGITNNFGEFSRR